LYLTFDYNKSNITIQHNLQYFYNLYISIEDLLSIIMVFQSYVAFKRSGNR
jgi:hypothetical protein